MVNTPRFELDPAGCWRLVRPNGTTQIVLRVDMDSMVRAYDKGSKAEVLLPARRIGDYIVINLMGQAIDPLIKVIRGDK